MADGTGQTDWLEILAAEDRDALRAELIPADDEPWERVLVKHRRAREWFGSDRVMAVTPAGLSAYHGMMINLAIGRGELAYALATFDEMGTVAAPQTDDPQVREIACRAGDELVQALVEAADLVSAEQTFSVLNQLAQTYPDDADAVSTAAAAASYLVVGHCRRKDFERALACCNRVNHLYGNEELQPEIDLWHARSLVNLILALAEGEARDKARHIAHQRRELLLSPASLEDLAATRGKEFAAAIREFLEAMIATYEAMHPPSEPAGEPARRILDDYQFERLQTVTLFDFISMRVPARWTCRREDDGRWGCYEDDVESGSLWVDFNLFEIGEASSPDPDSVDAAMRSVVEGLERRREDAGTRVDLVPIENGRLVRLYDESADEHGPIASHRWHLVRASGNKVILVHFDLVIDLGLATRPDFQALVRSIEAEIAGADLQMEHFDAGR